MKKIEPKIPHARITYNYLYDSMRLDWMEQDLFFAILPNGNTIDVGWYPACDPDGQFKVALCDREQNQLKVKIVNTLEQVISAVERLAIAASDDKSRETSVSAEGGQRQFRKSSVHAMSSSTLTPPLEVTPQFF